MAQKKFNEGETVVIVKPASAFCGYKATVEFVTPNAYSNSYSYTVNIKDRGNKLLATRSFRACDLQKYSEAKNRINILNAPKAPETTAEPQGTPAGEAGKAKPKFKVGDRVYINKDESSYNQYAGVVSAVTKNTWSDSYSYEVQIFYGPNNEVVATRHFRSSDLLPLADVDPKGVYSGKTAASAEETAKEINAKVLTLEDAKTLYASNDEAIRAIALKFYTEDELKPEETELTLGEALAALAYLLLY